MFSQIKLLNITLTNPSEHAKNIIAKVSFYSNPIPMAVDLKKHLRIRLYFISLKYSKIDKAW